MKSLEIPKLPELPTFVTINEQTGEVIKREFGVITPVNDKFLLFFVENTFSNMCSKHQLMPYVYMKMVMNMDNENKVFVGKPFKLELIHKDKINLDIQSINNQISLLNKYGFIKQLAYSYYVVNPNYFAKGNMHQIARLRLQYDDIDK